MSQGFLTSAKLRMALIACIASLGMVLGACDNGDENNGNNTNNTTDTGSDAMTDAGEDTGEEDATGDTTETETAMVQVIHASPDPGAATVDVWVEGQDEPLLDDFAFETATPYTALPAGVSLNIGIAGPDSTSYADSLKTWEGVEFEADSTYVVIAHGIISPEGEQPALDLLVTDGKMTPDDDTTDEINVGHTSPDAPDVDLVLNNDGDNAVEGVAYGATTGYVPFANGITTIDIFAAGTETRAASFQTPDLAGGGTYVVLATGFLAPEGEEPAFGLTAFASDGTAIELDQAARAQIIHASPAAAADPVDLYLNGEIYMEDVPFTASTGFVTVPSGVALAWDVVPADGALGDSVASAELTFEPGDTAIAAAVGDGADQDFAIVPKGDAREAAMASDMVDVTVLHASPDAPSVNVGTNGPGGNPTLLADGLAFGAFTDGYVEAGAADITITVFNADTDNAITDLAAPLSAFEGSALTVVATGYAAPEGDEPALQFRVYDGTGGTGTQLSAP